MSEIDGELAEMISKIELEENTSQNWVGTENPKRSSKNKMSTKKKNKRNMNRFVKDVCKRLRERRYYLVGYAVACLGVLALSDLVDEVKAIQAYYGGQKTSDGSHRRFRYGGRILWNIIKLRHPNAYNEIMRKGKKFEINKAPTRITGGPRIIKQKTPAEGSTMTTDQTLVNASSMLHDSQQHSTNGPKRQSVFSRIS